MKYRSSCISIALIASLSIPNMYAAPQTSPPANWVTTDNYDGIIIKDLNHPMAQDPITGR